MGLFDFIGDALNSILGGNSARRDSQQYNVQNMAIQQQYAQQNMAAQNKYNVEAFNAENAYNSPLAQRQRMEQAGLNPNWEGPGSVVAQQDSAVSPSAPSGGMPSGSNAGTLSDLVNLATMAKDLKKKDSEINVNDSQTGLNKAKAAEAMSNAGKTDEEAVQVAPNALVGRQTQVTEQYKNQAQTALADSQREAQDKANEWIDQEKSAIVKELMSRSNLSEKQAWDIVESFNYRMKNLVQNTLESVSRTFKNYQDVEIAKKQLVLNGRQIQLGYDNLSEMRRHNMKLEQLQQQYNYIEKNYKEAQSSYLKSQGKYTDSLCSGQDIKNKVWDMDLSLRRYAKANHIDQKTLDLQLNALHNEAALLEEKVRTEKLTQDEVDQRLLTAPIGAVTGGFGNLGKSWSGFNQ